MSAETARQQLGHANISTTLSHYTDTGLREQSAAVTLLSSAICSAGSGATDGRGHGAGRDGQGRPVDRSTSPSQDVAAKPMSTHTPTDHPEPSLPPGTLASHPHLNAGSARDGHHKLSLVGSTEPAAKRTGASRRTRASGVEPVAPAAPAALMTIGHRTIRLEVGPGTEALIHRVLDLVEHAVRLERHGSPGADRVETKRPG